jgi:hypothetical protein
MTTRHILTYSQLAPSMKYITIIGNFHFISLMIWAYEAHARLDVTQFSQVGTNVLP